MRCRFVHERRRVRDVQTDVRLARPEDLPAMVAAFGHERYFAGRLKRQAAGVGELFVAWRGATPIGDVVLIREPVPEQSIRERLPGVPQISHLEVAQAYQRQGVASMLLDAAERHAYAHGHSSVVLGVGVTNPARALYDRTGYDDWGFGTVLFEWADPEPDSELCHVMIKLLDPDVPPLTAWQPWEPDEVARRLAGCPVPWAVAAGWAVDLHLGRPTRPHSDIEVAIPAEQFERFRRYFDGFDLYEAGDGRVRRLVASEPPTYHQVWVSEPAVPAWRMDTFLEPGDERTWVSHRDPSVTMPLESARRFTATGIPYLAPEIVLLAKAKHARDKDVADFDQLLPTLDQPARQWLADALARVHPGHAWLARLFVAGTC
jgi:ribosomal protein S18 acetylase RimI-like enzyme